MRAGDSGKGYPTATPFARWLPQPPSRWPRSPARTPVNEIANSDPETTESIPPFSTQPQDRTAPEGALAYAESPDDASAVLPSGTGATGQAAPRATVTGPLAVRTGADEMTIAVKRVSGRPTSAILTVAKKTSSAILANTARLDDPWLRAVVWSPSVHHFLYVTELGVRDFRSLSGLMVKPAQFGADDLCHRSAVWTY